jgi:segregation and condensation protein B
MLLIRLVIRRIIVAESTGPETPEDVRESAAEPADSHDMSAAAHEPPVEASAEPLLDPSGDAAAVASEADAQESKTEPSAAPESVETESDLGMFTDADELPLQRPGAELVAIVEALIFASPEPLSPKALFKLLDTEPREDVLTALDAVKAAYERSGGLQLVEVAGGFQIVTRPDLHEWVRRLFHERSTQKLSVQALETLAVIAYRQPITAVEVTEIRGVNTSGVLNTLLERHLIKIVGRKQVVGRPFMYATTREFLIRFGLKDLSDLPKVEDMAEALGIESPLLVERSPSEEQLPLSEPDGEVSETAGEPD